jgi:hypothetical protein
VSVEVMGRRGEILYKSDGNTAGEDDEDDDNDEEDMEDDEEEDEDEKDARGVLLSILPDVFVLCFPVASSCACSFIACMTARNACSVVLDPIMYGCARTCVRACCRSESCEDQ